MTIKTWIGWLAVLLASGVFPCMAAEGVSAGRVTLPPSEAPANEKDSARVVLQRYAGAWRGRQELPLDFDVVVCFWVHGDGGGEYHVVLSQEAGAVVQEGIPDQYDLGFELNIDFLRRLDRGEINALTAMGQAHAGEPIPLVPKFGSAFERRPDMSLLFRRLCFHFWTRDWPEVVRFGEGSTRQVHGAEAAVLFYDEDFRSAWYQLKSGMHINADAADQTNGYSNVIIVTRGRLTARLGGSERILVEGDAVFIPAGMTHEFWADGNQYAELVWIAFGKGS